MKRILLTLILLAAVTTYAKDRQYETGTVERVTVAYQGDVAGDRTDCRRYGHTVDCYSSTVRLNRDAFDYFLTFADGTRHHISHVPLSRDVIKSLDYSQGAVSVRYRIQRKMGATSIEIADPNGKEGSYITEDKIR